MLDVLTRAGCFVAIILLGFLLRRVGLFHKENFAVLSKLAIKVTLPAAIVASFSGKSFDLSMLSIVLLGLGCGVLYMAIGFLLHLRQAANKRAFFVLNLPGYNIGCFTMPFAQSFLGPMGVIVTSLFDTGNAFVCLGGAYGVASMIKDGGGFSARRLFKTPCITAPDTERAAPHAREASTLGKRTYKNILASGLSLSPEIRSLARSDIPR